MMVKKVISQSGESIGETLVALLISALALVMLAGAISASLGVVNRGRAKMGSYYSANEEANGVIKRTGTGTAVSDGILITDSLNSGNIVQQKYDVTYYRNNIFNNKPVVAYKYSPTS